MKYVVTVSLPVPASVNDWRPELYVGLLFFAWFFILRIVGVEPPQNASVGSVAASGDMRKTKARAKPDYLENTFAFLRRGAHGAKLTFAVEQLVSKADAPRDLRAEIDRTTEKAFKFDPEFNLGPGEYTLTYKVVDKEYKYQGLSIGRYRLPPLDDAEPAEEQHPCGIEPVVVPVKVLAGLATSMSLKCATATVKFGVDVDLVCSLLDRDGYVCAGVDELQSEVQGSESCATRRLPCVAPTRRVCSRRWRAERGGTSRMAQSSSPSALNPARRCSAT